MWSCILGGGITCTLVYDFSICCLFNRFVHVMLVLVLCAGIIINACLCELLLYQRHGR